MIEEPNSKDWQKRSKAGDEKKWRRDVEEHTAKGDEGLGMGFCAKYGNYLNTNY